MKATAIIPARGNSKSVVKKNIRHYKEKPLVFHSIQQAIDSALIGAIFVSTEDREIALACIEYGNKNNVDKKPFYVFKRPLELSQDQVQVDEVALFTLRQMQRLGIYPQSICVLQPTSPTRTAKEIDKAIALHLDGGKTVITANEEKGFFWDKEGFPLDHEPLTRLGRQWYTDWPLKENGSIYVVSAKYLEKYKSIRSGDVVLMITQDIDIDEENELV